jgi:hypothetical protein
MSQVFSFLLSVTNDGRTDGGTPKRFVTQRQRLRTMGQPKIISTSPQEQQLNITDPVKSINWA